MVGVRDHSFRLQYCLACTAARLGHTSLSHDRCKSSGYIGATVILLFIHDHLMLRIVASEVIHHCFAWVISADTSFETGRCYPSTGAEGRASPSWVGLGFRHLFAHYPDSLQSIAVPCAVASSPTRHQSDPQ
jgi:hypothetical protein